MQLSFNNFSGELPKSLFNLTKLEVLDFSSNALSGFIPLRFGSSLREIHLQSNLFTGPIPATLSSIPSGLSNCTDLNWISLSSNHFTGEIPSWIGRLENLAILKLGNNSFSGSIPPELGDCKSLIWLDLKSNRLSGTIPSTLSKQSGNISVGFVTGKRYVYLKNDGSKECRVRWIEYAFDFRFSLCRERCVGEEEIQAYGVGRFRRESEEANEVGEVGVVTFAVTGGNENERSGFFY
ncbi:Protein BRASSINOSTEROID INSENSITIVE 1 [Dendrobium catenatum]|uniref:non-specific serine/threonine protein kinase n=1 Tax=Dendrobium catenatum TaxID=906689 RepID=A0A2I0XIY1_9ASPA|nr:Protein BRASSINOSTEROID INSENSITIVE 1 [Dendrobium catenatum]